MSVEGQIQTVRQSVERLRMAIREAGATAGTVGANSGCPCPTATNAGSYARRDDGSRLEADLMSLANRIERLAINLAAIDEYEMQSQRKRYLDEQNADLEEALETLENAIRKIDQETRQKFRETFDQVNGGLQSLFPQSVWGKCQS